MPIKHLAIQPFGLTEVVVVTSFACLSIEAAMTGMFMKLWIAMLIYYYRDFRAAIMLSPLFDDYASTSRPGCLLAISYARTHL